MPSSAARPSPGTVPAEASGAGTTAAPAVRPERRSFIWTLLLTAAVGWIASGILVIERLRVYADADYITSCDINPWVSCGTVFQTWQASIFGFPNPLIGIVAFAVVITTAAGLLAGAQFARWYWIELQIGVTLGMVFVVWLWSQALFDIYVLCIYCIVVWAAMIPLFVFTTIRNLAAGTIPAPANLVRFLTDWSWPIVVLLWIATAASIFFRFLNSFVGG
ncbi:vitamin K epoxide reductase family protein [Arthrobacter sp. zg-Y877]|uniref:vitamin K epoxide reductase family protein n=1 Tax=Arthrobacter sp. zg-Y877 TaxID=3049074 RepID=UPI0025A45602|nr:vitamin K epoxide reductase family protein [Arthrobacter sp. zg-Y877]MDM7989509.1 vitamin K epoxide reductase family protein [Arthrobacter sp. zg-Y877]